MNEVPNSDTTSVHRVVFTLLRTERVFQPDSNQCNHVDMWHLLWRRGQELQDGTAYWWFSVPSLQLPTTVGVEFTASNENSWMCPQRKICQKTPISEELITRTKRCWHKKAESIHGETCQKTSHTILLKRRDKIQGHLQENSMIQPQWRWTFESPVLLEHIAWCRMTYLT